MGGRKREEGRKLGLESLGLERGWVGWMGGWEVLYMSLSDATALLSLSLAFLL